MHATIEYSVAWVILIAKDAGVCLSIEAKHKLPKSGYQKSTPRMGLGLLLNPHVVNSIATLDTQWYYYFPESLWCALVNVSLLNCVPRVVIRIHQDHRALTLELPMRFL